MARYLIEVPHEEEEVAYARVVGLNKFSMEQIEEILVHHRH